MKKILIIADGILAKNFLERVIDIKTNDNRYDVVTYRDRTLPKKKMENVTFYNFDPTSLDKLSSLLVRDYYQVMIVMSKKVDAMATYKNVRLVNKELQVVLLDRWDTSSEQDNRLEILNTKDIISSRFIDFLPNMPVLAQNVGLGAGEIMEMRVPIGSSYVYRHIGSIEQKKWKISAIYRSNSLILPRPSLMIQPNDVLLVVGDPIVLQSVYRSIIKKLGQFPAPFGNSIYCMIDMALMKPLEIDKIINDALLLHAKISSVKLYIRIINPTASDSLKKLKSYHFGQKEVEIEYYSRNIKEVMSKDIEAKDIGLIVTTSKFFAEHTKFLYHFKLPVFKAGAWGFSKLKEGIILSSSNEDIEKESAIIFDLSSQLHVDIKLYDFDPNNTQKGDSLAEHFENLSKIFGKNVEIIVPKKNPLIKLSNRDDIIQFVPFNKKILESNIFSIFSTDMDSLYFKLYHSYQVFIPMQV